MFLGTILSVLNPALEIVEFCTTLQNFQPNYDHPSVCSIMCWNFDDQTADNHFWSNLLFTLARLRGPHDGLFTGQIDAVDTVNCSYRVTFDRPGLYPEPVKCSSCMKLYVSHFYGVTLSMQLWNSCTCK